MEAVELSVEALGERIRQKVNILFERGDLDGSARNALLDTLSTPAPEVDEATVWTRKTHAALVEVRYPMFAKALLAGERDNTNQHVRARQVLSELIASKDAEIERPGADVNKYQLMVIEWQNKAAEAQSKQGDMIAELSAPLSHAMIVPTERYDHLRQSEKDNRDAD